MVSATFTSSSQPSVTENDPVTGSLSVRIGIFLSPGKPAEFSVIRGTQVIGSALSREAALATLGEAMDAAVESVASYANR